MFIGRKKEKEDIISHLSDHRFEYLLIYGMRRVGKTKLINECLKESQAKVISYTFRDINTPTNLKEFISYIPQCFNESYLSFNDLKGCLTYLCEKAKQEDIILFIDEYPFLRREDRGIDSYFQEIKNIYEDSAHLKIIFCGSYAHIMFDMIEASSPLYGRFSYILNLLPFDYYEASLFMGNISNNDKFKYYACFGGLGFTLANIDFTQSFEDNLKHLLIEPDALFEREALSIINQDVNKIPEAKFVLECIGQGLHKYADINTAFNSIQAGQSVAYLLNKLQSLNIIEKVTVINEEKKKSDLYVIKDNLLDFYYTFLSHSLNERSNLGSDAFYERIKESIEKNYLAKAFEDVSKEFLIRINRHHLLKSPFSLIGRLIYHDKKQKKNGELDVVLKDDKGYIDIECKYYNRPISLKDYNEEKAQLDNLGLPYRMGFISKMGFDDTYPLDTLETIRYSLDDFYKDNIA